MGGAVTIQFAATVGDVMGKTTVIIPILDGTMNVAMGKVTVILPILDAARMGGVTTTMIDAATAIREVVTATPITRAHGAARAATCRLDIG